MKYNSTNIMQVAYNLHNTADNPNMIQIWDREGNKYAIDRDGNAYILTDEEYRPLPYNPYPWVTIQAKVMRRLPRFILVAATIAATILLVYFTIMFDCPPCQEAFLNAAALWGWATQLAFTVAFSLTLIAVAIWHFAKGIRIEQLQPIFEQNSEQTFLCLIASNNEHDRSIEERLRVALAQMSDDQSPVVAVAVVRFQDPVAYLYTRAQDKDPRMDRCAPKYITMPEYTDKLFVAETWEEYEEYCTRFYNHMKEHLMKVEHRRAGRVSDATQNHLKLLKNFALALLLTVTGTGLFAQKSVQVERYLGPERYTLDKPVGKVKFVFSGAVIERPGDGKFTYKELLPNSRYYNDKDDAGKLISIHVGQNRILPVRPSSEAPETPAPTTPAPTASTDPVRPRPLFPAPQPLAQEPFLPDSAQMAQNMQHIQTNFDAGLKQIKVVTKPIWELIMYFFLKTIAVLIGILGFCRYIAKTAAKESAMNKKGRTIVGGWIMNAQQNAAGFTLVVTWIITGFLLIDIFFFLLSFDLSIWLLIVLWFPILWLAEKLTDWLVVNPSMLKKGEYRQ